MSSVLVLQMQICSLSQSLTMAYFDLGSCSPSLPQGPDRVMPPAPLDPPVSRVPLDGQRHLGAADCGRLEGPGGVITLTRSRSTEASGSLNTPRLQLQLKIKMFETLKTQKHVFITRRKGFNWKFLQAQFWSESSRFLPTLW